MNKRLLTVVFWFVAGCAPQPAESAPGVARQKSPQLDEDMAAVLSQYEALNPQPIQGLTPQMARLQPMLPHAVRAELIKRGLSTEPESVASVAERTIAGQGGAIPLRVYTPQGDGPFPVILYFHGGGWVVASLDTYDSSARALANAAGAMVISVEYRKAPESRFPAAHDDAFAAYTWALADVGTLNGDPARIALAGEGAGGNLALATAIRARDVGLRQPAHVLAVYPIADGDTESSSYTEYASTVPLGRPAMEWFFGQYLVTPADALDPRISLVRAELGGLPPTTLVLAEFDPLNSDGKALNDLLLQANVDVALQEYAGSTHEFFGLGAVVEDARAAVEFAAQRLKESFGVGAP